MKKTVSMLLASIALVSTAHAEFQAVTNGTEVQNIKKAVKMALDTTDLASCSYSERNGAYRSYTANSLTKSIAFADNIFYAGTVYRQDDGQPVLQFFSESYSVRTYITVTTDSTGTKLVSMVNQQTKKASDETVNRGTLARPEFVVVPGQWETASTTSCTFK